MFLRAAKHITSAAIQKSNLRRVVFVPISVMSTKKTGNQNVVAHASKSNSAKVSVETPAAEEPKSKPKTWYQKLLAGKSASEAVDDVVPEEEPMLAYKEQVRQHDFRDPMDGILIYGVDTQGYKEMLKGYAPPVGTLVTALGALSLYTWDVLSMSVWVVAGMSPFNFVRMR